MMDVFQRLAPFVREHLYAAGWQSLRPVQLAAAAVLFGSDDHLLLSSGTASGKTEAALLPVLTLLHEAPAPGVGVLYISPLKALINDQFARLAPLLQAGHMPLTRWHGDAASPAKQALLRAPAGMLQITPESLEHLLLAHRAELPRLFAGLRFVLVDEAHSFCATERGLQLQCQLVRLDRLAGCAPRRIGLSATLGDPQAAAAWLAAGTDRPCQCPVVQEPPRALRLRVCAFAPHEDARRTQALFAQTLGKKTIVFANARSEAETMADALKTLAAAQHSPDVYRVHHGNVAAALRLRAEQEMKQSDLPLVLLATSTLELGLDIGDLDQVVQLGAPFSVASLVQRLGRCGRQGQPARLLFLLQTKPSQRGGPLEQLDWGLLKTVAALQLYLHEKWVEPLQCHAEPTNLLYHQTMLTLAAVGEMPSAALARELLTLPAFAAVTQAAFKHLLHHLLATHQIATTESGALQLTATAEARVLHFDFLSVFAAPKEYEVLHQGVHVGTLHRACTPGAVFLLAGRAWRAERCSPDGRVVAVPVPGGGATAVPWEPAFGAVAMHPHWVEQMRVVLQQTDDYAYLDPTAQEALARLRQAAAAHPSEVAAWLRGLTETPPPRAKFAPYFL